MSRIALFSIALLLFTHHIALAAIQVTYDPGTVGSSFNFSLDNNLPELTGSIPDDRSYTLDFVFADMKHLEVETLDFNFLTFEVFFATDFAFSQTSSPNLSVSGFLSDENGANIRSADSTISGVGMADINGTFQPVITTGLEFDTLADGLIFHDIHLSFSFSDADSIIPDTGGSITAASFSIGFEGGAADSELVVGEWVASTPDPVVPEPYSCVVWGG